MAMREHNVLLARSVFSLDINMHVQLISLFNADSVGSRRAVRVAFNMLDVNGDHTIDKKEFSVVCTRNIFYLVLYSY